MRGLVYGPAALAALGLALAWAGAARAQSADEVVSATTYQTGSASAASNLLPVAVSSGSGDGALTATATTTYDAVGNVLTVDGPLPGTADTTRYVWDAMRQQVGVIGPDPDGPGPRLFPATRTTYDANGQITKVERGVTTGQSDAAWAGFSPLRTDTTDYDAQGRKIRDTAAVGTADAMVSQYSYDSAGRLVCSTVRMNPAVYGSLPASACTLGPEGTNGPDRITHYAYDAADRLVSTIDGYLSPTPRTESQTWTANGKVATRTDGNGNLSTYVYDGFDRIGRLRFPNASGGGSSTTDYEDYGYDAANNVTAFRNRAGETEARTYDALNRPTLTVRSAAPSTAWTYDNLGRVLTTSGDGLVLGRGWDALGRMTHETSPLGTVAYQYDLAGRRTRMTWPDGLWIQYHWTLDNGLSAIRENGAADWALATYAYDNLGRRIAAGLGNGATTTWTYDAASRLTGLTQDPAGTAQDVTFSLTYSPASQILSRTSSNPTFAYTPAAGAVGYVNNGRNQVTSAGGASIGYDARFNITATPTGGYGFNGLNQMTAATVGGTTTGLTYDPAGRLYQVGATRFLYDGAQAIAEYDASGAITQRYVPGSGTDETIVAYAGAGYDRRWLLADERGSIIAQADNAGAVTAINTYDEYGRPGSGNLGRFQYTGQMWLGQAGVYHYKARAYEPELGRFLQTDPVGYQDGLNLYAYVANDPVNNTDPTGETCVTNADGSRSCNYELRNLGPGTAGAILVGSQIWNAGVGIYNAVTNRSDSRSQARTESQTNERRRDSYVVRVQAQGDGLTTERSIPIQGTSPIPLRDVHVALSSVAGQLSPSEQAAMRPAFVAASQWATQVAAGGGIGPIGSQSFDNGKDSRSEYRVDIEILAGERNIVPR